MHALLMRRTVPLEERAPISAPPGLASSTQARRCSGADTRFMKTRQVTCLLCGVLVTTATVGLHAGLKHNPYGIITQRNAFGLRPPPPPPPPPSAIVRPPPSLEVKLTGICKFHGIKRVLLRIKDQATRQKFQYLSPLAEGEKEGRIQIVSIRPKTESVVITVDGQNQTLTFAKNTPKPAGAAPRPGMSATSSHSASSGPLLPSFRHAAQYARQSLKWARAGVR